MRIVSLLPAVTEWVYTFGAGNALVGRSHACDYPSEVSEVPVVTRADVETDTDSAGIDRNVRRRISDGMSLYDVDLERLKALAPDVIITQDQCEVCAVSLEALEEWVSNEVSEQTTLLSIAPRTLKDAFDTALRIGRAIGRLETAMQVVASGEKRLQRLMDRLGINREGKLRGAERPSVLCIEWIDPLMAAGHWMPDVVEKAGGTALLGRAGEPSHYISWPEVLEVDPDVIVFVPCGYDLKTTRDDLGRCSDRTGWNRLTAVREDRVYLLDGSAYFNRPGPRLYRSIELMAKVLHPDRVQTLEPPVRDWELAAPVCSGSEPYA
jgi:iron complex transport system substrate-binding protein